MKRKKPTISQTMNNSPGGVQAAGDVTINQAPQPRVLSPQQRERLRKELTAAQTKGPIIIQCFDSVFDSCDLAREIRDAVLAAGWPDLRFRQIGFSNLRAPVGLFLQVPKDEPRHGGNLQHALNSIHLEVGAVPDASMEEGVILLVIGSRP